MIDSLGSELVRRINAIVTFPFPVKDSHSGPPLIYKYFGKHGVDVVNDLELKVTPPNEFNDLFEVTPRPSQEVLSQEAFDELIASNEGKAWLASRLSSSEKFRIGYARLGGSPRKFYELAAPLMSGVAQRTCEDLLNELSKHFGVICFCDDPTHLLMWAHYSEGHRGIVIGFDQNKLNLAPIDPVNYVTRRIQYAPPWRSADRNHMKAVVTSKSDLWRYEAERRVMLKLERLRKRRLEDGSNAYFAGIAGHSIAEVILGFRCSADHAIRDALIKNKIQASLKRAKPHPTEFSVRLEVET